MLHSPRPSAKISGTTIERYLERVAVLSDEQWMQLGRPIDTRLTGILRIVFSANERIQWEISKRNVEPLDAHVIDSFQLVLTDFERKNRSYLARTKIAQGLYALQKLANGGEVPKRLYDLVIGSVIPIESLLDDAKPVDSSV
jgi:hypothetical protein